MQITNIKFIQGREGADPSAITVTMTIEEAIWIAEIAGKQRGDSPHLGIYDCLVGDLFNRYWDGGVDDAIRIYPVEIPPIIYKDE